MAVLWSGAVLLLLVGCCCSSLLLAELLGIGLDLGAWARSACCCWTCVGQLLEAMACIQATPFRCIMDVGVLAEGKGSPIVTLGKNLLRRV